MKTKIFLWRKFYEDENFLADNFHAQNFTQYGRGNCFAPSNFVSPQITSVHSHRFEQFRIHQNGIRKKEEKKKNIAKEKSRLSQNTFFPPKWKANPCLGVDHTRKDLSKTKSSCCIACFLWSRQTLPFMRCWRRKRFTSFQYGTP